MQERESGFHQRKRTRKRYIHYSRWNSTPCYVAPCYVPGWEQSLENGSMYMYGWVLSLFTWSYHNICLLIGYTPVQNKKFKRKKIKQTNKKIYIKKLTHTSVGAGTESEICSTGWHEGLVRTLRQKLQSSTEISPWKPLSSALKSLLTE